MSTWAIPAARALQILGFVMVGFGLALLILKTPPPVGAEPCRDIVEVGYRPSVICPPGTRAEVYPGGDRVLVKCVCPPVKK